MKKILILILGLFGVAYGQTTGYFRYDSVRFEKIGGNSEFILLNATRSVTGGVLTNTGNGRTAFVSPAVVAPAWLLAGNALTTPGTDFLGTTDNKDIVLKRNSVFSGILSSTNTTFGVNAMSTNGTTTGSSLSAAFGVGALQVSSGGVSNTAVGYQALTALTNSSNNTAVGYQALGSSTTPTDANIGIGYRAGYYNTTSSSPQIFIGSIDRGSYANEQTRQPIYVQQHASVLANQNVYFNGNIYLPYIQSAAGTKQVRVNPGTGLLSYGDTLASPVGGSGTLNYLPKWTPNGTTLGNSGITDDGTTIGIAGSAAILSLGGGATAAKLRFLEPSGSGTNYSEFSSVAQAANLSYTLPPAFVSGGVLTDAAGNGTLTWAAPTVTPSNTVTLTNKRWTARVGSTTSSATPTINTDDVDIYKLTAQAGDITSMTTNLSGTPVDGDILEIQVTGTAARAITWGASFVSSTVTLPTTTVTTATLTTVFQYYTTSSYGNNKWVCVNYF